MIKASARVPVARLTAALRRKAQRLTARNSENLRNRQAARQNDWRDATRLWPDIFKEP